MSASFSQGSRMSGFILEGFGVSMPPGGMTCKPLDPQQQELFIKLFEMIRNAERERCARIAEYFTSIPNLGMQSQDKYTQGWNASCSGIAAKIRTEIIPGNPPQAETK